MVRAEELESWAAKSPNEGIILATINANPKIVRSNAAAYTVNGSRKKHPDWQTLAKDGWQIVRVHIREGNAFGHRTKKS